MKLKAWEIAKIAYATELEYSKAIGETGRVPWDSLTKKDQEALAVTVKYAICCGDPIEKVHNRWVVKMKEMGLTEEDNPLIKPWHLLPKEKRVRDVLYICNVRAMASVMDQNDINCSLDKLPIDSFSEGNTCSRCK